MSIVTEITRLQKAKANIKTAIENKGVTVGDGTIDTYAEKISQISGGGSVDGHYDTFWDNYQNNGNRVKYDFAFAGEGWNEQNIKPKYNITPTTATYMFANCQINDLKALFDGLDIVLDFSKATNMNYVCQYSKVKVLPDLDVSSMTRLSNIFRYANTLETITIKGLNATQVFDATFSGATALTNLTLIGALGTNFNIANSSKLSDTSIQNIIDCLADLTGSTSQTLTLHATVGAKLTDEQKATITSKNWTLVY